MKREIILTRDGSHTIAIPEWQVMYHSINGAIKESRHVYIHAGLHYAFDQFSDVPLRVFEMGFGTGLNALLTAMEAKQARREVQYTSIEAYPLTPGEIQALNYGESLNNESLFTLLHQAAWDEPVIINSFFTMQKKQVLLGNVSTSQLFHLIYYDAFAPAGQPELWTQGVFENLYSMLVPGGMLVTYCSKSDVRRAMQAAGFVVTKLPGPPRKREMLRAKRGPLSPEGET